MNKSPVPVEGDYTAPIYPPQSSSSPGGSGIYFDQGNITTSGYLLGLQQLLGFAYYDQLRDQSYFCYFDPFDLNDQEDDCIYKTRQEDWFIYRKPTPRGVVIVYRDRGPVTARVTISTVTDFTPSSKSVTVQFGTPLADMVLKTVKVDMNGISGERPQVTIEKLAGQGMLDIISITNFGSVESTTLS